MKPLNLIAAGLLVTVVLSAFFTEQLVKEDVDPEGRVVVTYWEKWTNFEADAMRAVVNEFNRRQDKIFVKYLSVTGVGDKTMLATAGGIPPDVAGLYGPNVAQYAFYNAVIPLDEMAAEAGIKRDDYVPVYYDMCTYRGKLWCLPSTPATNALHVNIGKLREAGVDPNTPLATIEDLDAMDAKLVKRDGSKITRMGFLPTEPGWWNWAWGYYFGGSIYDGENRLTIDSPENVRAFEWMQGYVRRYGQGNVSTFTQGFGGFDTPQNAFMDGKVASVLQGVWMSNFINKHRPNMEWKALPFPYPADRPDVANTTMADTDILAIPRGAKHPKEAFEFIKFVQSQEGMELLCLGQRKQSPLKKVSPEFLAKHPNPAIKLFNDLGYSKNAVPPPKIPIWPQIQAELNSAIQEINQLKISPKEALGKVQKKMQPVLDETMASESRRSGGKVEQAP